MMEPESSWLDKLKCRLGLHTWWIAPNAEVWLLGEEETNVDEEAVAMNVIPPDLVGHAQFCIHCRSIHGVIVNNKLVKLKGVKAVYVE
jgi:hypothetical protein